MQRTATPLRHGAIVLRSFFSIIVTIACCQVSRSDDFSWLGGSSHSWTDTDNWASLQHPMGGAYPGGGDVVTFSYDDDVSLDGGQTVGTADFDASVTLSNGTLQVTGDNLLRVGNGRFSSLTIQSGTTINANGTLAGVGATGQIWLSSGSALHDAHEISIGYTKTGMLSIENGGIATSAGAVFMGGFSEGDGDVLVSDSGSMLNANDFISVGNLGMGSLIVSGGGQASTQTNLFVGGFATGNGGVDIYDSGSKLTVTQQVEVGSAGKGYLNISSGGTASAKNVLVGAASSGQGDLYVQGNGSKLTVTEGSLAVGNQGKGNLEITSHGLVSVSGGGSLVSVGDAAGSNGTLKVEENGSTLSVQNGQLYIGRSGQGKLQIASNGLVEGHEVIVAAAQTSQGTVTIDGAGSKLAANDYIDVAAGGIGQVDITNGGKLDSMDARVGLGGEGTVNVTGAGSVWLNSGGVSTLTLGETTKGTLNITSGGKVASDGFLILGGSTGGEGYVNVDGASSTLEAYNVTLGSRGKGVLTLQNGGKFTSTGPFFLGIDNGGKGQLIVDGASSQFTGGAYGIDVGIDRGTGTITIRNMAHATTSASLRDGRVEVSSGGQLTLSSLSAAVERDHAGDLVVDGAGSSLIVQSDFSFGKFGDVSLLVQAGGSATFTNLQLQTAPPGTPSTGAIRVLSGGNLTVDRLSMSYDNQSLEVGAGGHLWAKSVLKLGSAHLQMSGGSIDVGTLIGPPETNFVRVGLGGHFSASGSVPNVRKQFDADVHVGGSPGTLNVTGTYIQESGSTSFSITGTQAGAEYSQLVVGGNLQLAGSLVFSFQDGFAPQAGQTFDVITVGGTSQLNNLQIQVKNVAPSFQYTFAPFAGGYRLTALTEGQYSPDVPGDLSGDGVVDARDYVIWRNYVGTRFTQADYNTWRAHFGQTAGSSPSFGSAVPEPSLAILLNFAAYTAMGSRKHSVRRRRT